MQLAVESLECMVSCCMISVIFGQDQIYDKCLFSCLIDLAFIFSVLADCSINQTYDECTFKCLNRSLILSVYTYSINVLQDTLDVR